MKKRVMSQNERISVPFDGTVFFMHGVDKEDGMDLDHYEIRAEREGKCYILGKFHGMSDEAERKGYPPVFDCIDLAEIAFNDMLNSTKDIITVECDSDVAAKRAREIIRMRQEEASGRTKDESND